MIFLAVGTQLPFDRLTRAVDEWCGQTGRGAEVFGQVGRLEPGNYRPVHFNWAESLAPDDFAARLDAADVIVAHAGMGTIISALSRAKPILVMARRVDLKEHRNDHQAATVAQFRDRPGVTALDSEADLPGSLDALGNARDRQGGSSIAPHADDRLIGVLRDFIHLR